MAVKPKLCMIPSGVGTDKLYSVLPADGTGDFTFDRNLNTATRINKDGLIEMVNADVPRLNYPLIDGVVSGCPSLLLEPESRNLITHSEDFTQGWTESNSIITSNQVISPDGTLNADKLTKSDINGSIIKGYTFVGGEVFSIFAKADESNILTIDNGDGRSYFDLINGTYNAASGGGYIEHYGNGWYRCTVKNSYVGASTIRAYTSDSLTSVSGTTGSLYIWGAQSEEQSYPTSYIPTSGTTATRSAETCNNSGDANTFNDSEGVLMAEISALANDGTSRQISISNGGTTERVYFGFRANANEFILSSRDSSYLIANISDVTNFNKYAFQYKSGSFKAFINGFDYDLTLDGGLLPTGLNTLNFDSGAGDQNFYGNTKQIQYFDTALTDTDLEELTSWTSFNEMAESQQYTIE